MKKQPITRDELGRLFRWKTAYKRFDWIEEAYNLVASGTTVKEAAKAVGKNYGYVASMIRTVDRYRETAR